MLRRVLMLVLVCVAIGVLPDPGWAGAPAESPIADEFGRASPGTWASILERQKALINGSDRQIQARYLAELGTMAMAMGHRDEAFQAIDRAADIMLDFKAEGKNRVGLLKKEENKEWKGESYEKLAAFTYLGMLYAERGDLGSAQAMFKTAVIADAGTAEERFLGDWVLGYVLQAWVLEHFGEPENAADAMKGAAEALRTRYVMDALSSVRPTAEDRLDPKKFLILEDLTLDAMAFTMVEEPDDTAVAFIKAVRMAMKQAQTLLELKRSERPAKYASLNKATVDRMPYIQSVWLDKLEKVLPGAYAEADAAVERMNKIVEGKPNVMFVVEDGEGPEKVLLKMYGSMLSYDIDEPGPDTLEGALDGEAIELYLGDSLGFQATSRGGRRMDELNRKKAQARGAMLGIGVAAMGAGVLIAQKDPKIGAIVIVAGALSAAGSLLVKATADARDWRNLPDRFYLSGATLPPGTHELVVGGRSIRFEVGSGPTIVHLPVRYSPLPATGGTTGSP